MVMSPPKGSGDIWFFPESVCLFPCERNFSYRFQVDLFETLHTF